MLFLRALPYLISGQLHILDGEYFISLLLNSRICWIRGILGGGKTSLAFILTAWLLKNAGYKYVASNIQNVFPKPKKSNGVFDAVAIFDEGGAFMDSRDWQSNPRQLYIGLRKMRSIVLLPSKNPPDKRLQELIVEPTRHIGKRIWQYYWHYELGSVVRSGTFSVVNPQKIFSYYATAPLALDDAGMLELFDISIRKANAIAKQWIAYEDDTEGVEE